ncbi:MAG: class I SAM-dependent methyltransferase [Betaproteobacteria bacterium]
MSRAPDPHASSEPSSWVRRHAGLLRPASRALDVAAGRGRHARFLASLGHQVVAVDRDSEALSALAGAPRIETRVLDLEAPAWPLAGERFDAIVVVNYLHRASFDAMLDTLSDEGVLVYETFAAGNEAWGRPSNPAFLLASGELLERVRGRLGVVSYEEGFVPRGGNPAVVQRIVAVGARRERPCGLSGA